MFREVFSAERAARRRHRGHDAPGDVTAVEGIGPAVAHGFQRQREVALDEGALGERVGMVKRPEMLLERGNGRGAEEIGLGRRRHALPRGGGESAARVGDGVAKEGLPGQGRAHDPRAVLMCLPPAVHGARHGQGRGTSADGNGLGHSARRVPLDAGGAGGSADPAERGEAPRPRVMDQPHVVAAHTVHVRVDDGDGGGGGDGGIERVAARAQRGEAGFRGQNMRRGDHAAWRSCLVPPGSSHGGILQPQIQTLSSTLFSGSVPLPRESMRARSALPDPRSHSARPRAAGESVRAAHGDL